MSDTLKFSNYKDLKTHFNTLLGEGSVLATSTGRPYIKIAQKGEAALLMNIALDTVAYKGTQVRSVCARFFQRGGEENSFAPPLKVRATSEDGSLRRLSKHHFPLCPIHPGINPVQSWVDQKVSDQMVSWVKGVIGFAQAEPMADEVIKTVVQIHLPPVESFEVHGDANLFNLDVQVEEEEAPVEASPTPGGSEASPAVDAAPPAKTPITLN